MMKNVKSLILLISTVFLLSACGGNKPKPSESSTPASEESVPVSEEESIPAPVSEESVPAEESSVEESIPAEESEEDSILPSEEESIPVEESSEEVPVSEEESVPAPVSEEESEPATSSVSEDDTSGLDPEDMNQTFNFYLDYSHTDTPLYTMRWWAYHPLGKCPEEAVLTDADAADPLFPHFLGYSRYPSAVDDSSIWDFATDNTLSATVNLYGIWVAID